MACMPCAWLEGISTFLNVQTTYIIIWISKNYKFGFKKKLKHTLTCHDTTLGQSSPCPFQKSLSMLHMYVLGTVCTYTLLRINFRSYPKLKCKKSKHVCSNFVSGYSMYNHIILFVIMIPLSTHIAIQHW